MRSRLERLKALRSRVDLEIADEERRLRERLLDQAGQIRASAGSTAKVRAWAVEQGIPVGQRGALALSVCEAYAQAHPTREGA